MSSGRILRRDRRELEEPRNGLPRNNQILPPDTATLPQLSSDVRMAHLADRDHGRRPTVSQPRRMTSLFELAVLRGSSAKGSGK